MKFFVTGYQMAGLVGVFGHTPHLSLDYTGDEKFHGLGVADGSGLERVCRSFTRVRFSLVSPSCSPIQLHIIRSAKSFPRGRQERHNPSLVVWCVCLHAE